MITQLSTYHDLRAIPVIRAFVLETGRYFGANDEEAMQLELAAEEAAAFIINAFRPEPDEPFEIESDLDPDAGFVVRLRNRGIPVDEEHLPTYDSRNPHASSAGLPLFLLEKMTDSITLQNEGTNGWVLILRKKLSNAQTTQTVIKKAAADPALCAKEKLEVGMATPEDAYGIVKLTYQTYHYSYAKTVFYYPEILRQAIADGSVVIFIARNNAGEIVVISSYIRSASSHKIAEAGMLMSHPDYRQNRALLRVSRMQSRYLKDSEHEMRVAYANLVTTHIRSQKLVKAYGFVPTAVILSVHDQSEFIGIDSGMHKRESLLYAVFAPNGLEAATIYLPQQHQSITENILQPFENLRCNTASQIPEKENSEFMVNRIESEQRAELAFETIGQDWYELLRKSVRDLKADGYITLHLKLPADRPLPQELDASLENLQFFYTGVMIKTMNRWQLIYTALHAQRFTFSDIAIYDPNAHQLLDSIRESYTRLENR
jgi:anti-sigma regulatory factor (Ser/Thr protein kinase)